MALSTRALSTRALLIFPGRRPNLANGSSVPIRSRGTVCVFLAFNPAPIHGLVYCLVHRGIPVLIDAAHALGQLPVDLQALGADFYVTNCHK